MRFNEYSGDIELKYDNGHLYSKGALINGKRDRLWHWWWPDGKVKQRVKYRDGKYHDKRLMRYKFRGRYVDYEVTYENGVLIEIDEKRLPILSNLESQMSRELNSN